MTPKDLGFTFPPEWAPHKATWLTFPHNSETWEDRLEKIYPSYLKFISLLAENELVNIVTNNEKHSIFVQELISKNKIDPFKNINYFPYGSNDSWCRDHGPSFVINGEEKAIIDWQYNAWGGKYPPYDLDNAIPKKVAESLSLPCFEPNIIMEGGSVEFNGFGTILTSKSCLLNKNRNPSLNKNQIEEILCDYYGQEQVLWVSGGIVGDDTDGHIDDFMRFVNKNTVIAAIEEDKKDQNFEILKQNLKELEPLKLKDGESINVVEIPMPEPIYQSNLRMPASYANFYIANEQVIVPIFEDKNDDRALSIIQSQFPDRKVIGLNSNEIIWGLGSFHCLSQQEPLINNNTI